MSEPGVWSDLRLGDLVDGFRGVSYQPCDLIEEQAMESVVLLRATNIQNGNLNFDNIQVVPARIVKQNQILNKGDIAVCMSNGSKRLVGKSAQLNEAKSFKCTIGVFCSVFRPKADSEPDFVKHLFGSDAYQAHIDISLAGSAINNLKNSDIESIPVNVPSKGQQKKIALILSTIDEAIKRTEALIGKYEQIKAGMMHDLFTRGLTAAGRLRPSRDQAPDIYQQTPIGWIPKEWSGTTIGSLTTMMTNGFVGTATPFYSDATDSIQYLYGNNIRPNRIDLEGAQRVTRRFHQTQQKSQLCIGDMLTVQSGHIGTSAIVSEGIGLANCHALIITRFKAGSVVPEFVSHYLNSTNGMNRLASIFVGSTILHINTSALYKFIIPVPESYDEQKMIVGRLIASQLSIDAERDHVSKLLKIKSGLMHDLLTGKVPVTVDEEEVANV